MGWLLPLGIDDCPEPAPSPNGKLLMPPVGIPLAGACALWLFAGSAAMLLAGGHALFVGMLLAALPSGMRLLGAPFVAPLPVPGSGVAVAPHSGEMLAISGAGAWFSAT